MKRIIERKIFFLLPLLFIFACADHEHSSENVNEHKHHYPFDGHTFSDIFQGSEEDTIVCYKKSHRNSFYLTMFLMVAVAGVSFNQYRIKKKSATALAKSNKIIEEKNKDILDSIIYAKRIQNSIMPSPTLPPVFDGFILYNPKDIVSGDFYWYRQEADKIFIAAVDCTGHGVPGALLSVIGAQSLQTAFNEEKDNGPAAMLRAMNISVQHALQKDKQNELQDGMEISLCIYNRSSGILQFSGAGRPLFVLSEGNLKEIKSPKFTIGSSGIETAFQQHEVQLEKSDCFYIFSDGYPDQFGGEHNKKFNLARFKNLLLSVSKMETDEQKTALSEAFDEWKKDFEQVDDVLIIGIRNN